MFKSSLFRILPYLPTSLPTLLFCRLAELTIFLEGNQSHLIEYEQWEELVQERLELMEVSNDIKIIGLFQKCLKMCYFS